MAKKITWNFPWEPPKMAAHMGSFKRFLHNLASYILVKNIPGSVCAVGYPLGLLEIRIWGSKIA